jgi:hypothetical protein
VEPVDSSGVTDGPRARSGGEVWATLNGPLNRLLLAPLFDPTVVSRQQDLGNLDLSPYVRLGEDRPL